MDTISHAEQHHDEHDQVHEGPPEAEVHLLRRQGWRGQDRHGRGGGVVVGQAGQEDAPCLDQPGPQPLEPLRSRTSSASPPSSATSRTLLRLRDRHARTRSSGPSRRSARKINWFLKFADITTKADDFIESATMNPAFEESAMFENMMDLMFKDEYDFYVFDTAPTANARRLLGMSKVYSLWVEKMLKSREEAKSLREVLSFTKKKEKDPLMDYLLGFKDRMAKAQKLLTDKALTAFFFVTLPESLPIAVITRFINWFYEFGIPVGGRHRQRRHPEGPDATRTRWSSCGTGSPCRKSTWRRSGDLRRQGAGDYATVRDGDQGNGDARTDQQVRLLVVGGGAGTFSRLSRRFLGAACSCTQKVHSAARHRKATRTTLPSLRRAGAPSKISRPLLTLGLILGFTKRRLNIPHYVIVRLALATAPACGPPSDLPDGLTAPQAHVSQAPQHFFRPAQPKNTTNALTIAALP